MNNLLISSFSIADTPIKEQNKFLKIFQEYDKTITAIKTYDELDTQEDLLPAEQIDINDIPSATLDRLEGIYNNIIDELKADNGDDDESVDISVDENYELESFHTKEVDEGYILGLIKNYISDANNEIERQVSTQNPDNQAQVDDYIDQYAKTNKPRADHIRSLWNEVQREPQKYSAQKVEEILQQEIDQESQQILQEFAKNYGLNYSNLQYVVKNFDPDVKNTKGMGDLTSKKFFEQYKEEHPNSGLTNWLKWKSEVREQVKAICTTKIKPLETEN